MTEIAILGSTGSIGRQALDVIALHPDVFDVVALTAHGSAEVLFEQARVFKPRIAALSGGEVAIPQDLRHIEWRFGQDALEWVAENTSAKQVLVSVVGIAGLKSVLAARRAGKQVLLANKEALVAGGALVMAVCADQDGQKTLIPVDSEHSAIFQCLQGADGNPVARILLTASGGPFRTWDKERMDSATVEQALGHPTWNMGAKITIDSASMFNKALEIIEAKWLFSVEPRQIEVLVHPQSIIHSLVEYADGAVIAQMGMPDMRVPILYAMSYPKRMETGTKRLELSQLSGLTFENPDVRRFPALRLAYETLEAGGAACAILNAANEVAVELFLRHQIPFGAISCIVEDTLQKLGNLPADTLADILLADAAARRIAGACAMKL